MSYADKIMSIYYGNDKLPYKDSNRQTHYPIGNGNIYTGENNTTKIRFYVDLIGGSNFTWLATIKLPNGSLVYKLTSGVQSGGYVELDISSLYTEIVGAIFVGLTGYAVGSVNIQYDSEEQTYTVSGDPDRLTTGVVKVIVNYSPQVLNIGSSVQPSEYQMLMGAISTKLDKKQGIPFYQNKASIQSDEVAKSELKQNQVIFDLYTNRFYKYDKANDTWVLIPIGGGGGSSYVSGNGIIVDNTNYTISIDGQVVATKTDLTSYATTTQLNNKLDKTGTTQEVEESANFAVAFVDDSEEPTKYSALRVVYGDDNKLVEAKVNDNGKEAIADITSETISFSVSEGDDTNGISITKDDATLTTMGESDNSIATKEYVDDVREIAEGKVQAITVSNTDTLASIKAYLENVSTAKAYLENGVEITASIKSGETYLVLNNLFTNDGISTDYIMLQSTGYVASQKNNDYYFYKADNNGLLAKKGNEILITQTNVPDWWSDGYQTVAGTTGIKVRLLETRKVDLSNYRTSAQQDVIDNGKQPLINSTNKLNPAYVNTDSSNRFVSDSEKSTWNGKSVVSVSDTGTATETVQYITINGVEKKLAGGGGSAEGAVKYNEAQTLTDNEKAQARSNIGASEVIYIDFGD